MNRVPTQVISPQPELHAGAGGVAPAASLPPTRAARPARSRGVFLAGRGEQGMVRGAVSLLCVAVSALSLVTLAPRVIDEPAVVANPAFELVATSVQLPAAVCSPQ
jgi:hypothetical protein